MKKGLIISIGILFLILIIAATVVVTLMFANSQNTSTTVDTNNSEDSEVITETELEPVAEEDTCTITSETREASEEMYEYSYTYPVFSCVDNVEAEDNLNGLVKNAVDTHISNIETSSADFNMRSVGNADYDVVQNNEKYVSARINYNVNLTGGTGDSGIIKINYDLENNEFVELKDLFPGVVDYVSQISQYSIVALKAKLGADASDDQIESGASVNADNFQTFVFDETSLTIVFNKYQVGPGALGNPEVSIPFNEIQ
jgi:hypothetical protein